MINLVSATPIEHELYYSDPDLRADCDKVSQMIQDLHDKNYELDVVLVLNDTDVHDEYTLAFGGTTKAMDFYPDRIEITDFDLAECEESEVLHTFDRDRINEATLWLVNNL